MSADKFDGKSLAIQKIIAMCSANLHRILDEDHQNTIPNTVEKDQIDLEIQSIGYLAKTKYDLDFQS